MMYNPNVTSVHVYVTNVMSKEAVQAVVESYARDMATRGCPYYTREILAPYEILDVPHRKLLFSPLMFVFCKEKIITCNCKILWILICRSSLKWVYDLIDKEELI